MSLPLLTKASAVRSAVLANKSLLQRSTFISYIKDVFKNEDYKKLDPEIYFQLEEKMPRDRFDYVVVGGGSAGCVLSWRLLEEYTQNRVALIESGPRFQPLTSRIPAGIGYAVQSDACTRKYYTVPQKNLNNRSIYTPRGRGIGGSSAINGLVFVRGHPNDYAKWVKQGADTWSYDECLPYFKKSERCRYGSEELRGKEGPMKLQRNMNGYCADLVDSFIKSGYEAGYKLSTDFSNRNHEGFGFYDLTVNDGMRYSTGRAYIPFSSQYLYKMNLEVMSGTKVDTILFEGDRAIGVKLANGKIIYANKEVILSAGAIETPAILMRSGVGDEAVLKSNHISVKQHLPGVGKNLQDHLEVYLQAEATPDTVSLHQLNSSMREKALSMYYWGMHGEGPFTTSYLDSGAFINTPINSSGSKLADDPSNPNVQLHFFPFLVQDHGKTLPKFSSFQIHAGTNRPESRGSVTLKDGQVVIDPNYLSAEKDLKELVECVEATRELFNQPSLARHVKRMIKDPATETNGDVAQFVRQNAETAYHPSCTCKIGADNDPDAVLDSKLKVRGLSNLRVVDASAMPSIVSANLNATVVMMAEKAADIILKDNGEYDPHNFFQTQ